MIYLHSTAKMNLFLQTKTDPFQTCEGVHWSPQWSPRYPRKVSPVNKTYSVLCQLTQLLYV